MGVFFRGWTVVSSDESPMGQILTTRVVRFAALVVGSGLFFALTSPFNAVTYLVFPVRWIYWIGLISITISVHVVVTRLWIDRLTLWRRALVVSVLATPLVFAAIVLVQQMIARPVPMRFWWSLLGSIWVINIVLALLAAQLDRLANQPTTTTPNSLPDPVAGIRKRLPVAARDATICALSAQDHYLDVILPDSHHLIHMRFGDALSMIAAEDGLQVHRSWWVAREAIKTISKQGRKFELQLLSGQTVPVSRAGAARMREAGWV